MRKQPSIAKKTARREMQKRGERELIWQLRASDRAQLRIVGGIRLKPIREAALNRAQNEALTTPPTG
jgi:hypothetical protein